MPNKINCQQCGKENVSCVDDKWEECLSCTLNGMHSEVLKDVKKHGLEYTRNEWKITIEGKEFKETFEKLAPSEKNQVNDMLRTIEDDLFPERKKARIRNRNLLIVGIVIAVLIVFRTIAYFYGKVVNKKKEVKE